MTESVMIAVVTVANHYRCTLCVSLCCDCMMNLSLAAPIRGIQLLLVSFASWDPIYTTQNKYINDKQYKLQLLLGVRIGREGNFVYSCICYLL